MVSLITPDPLRSLRVLWTKRPSGQQWNLHRRKIAIPNYVVLHIDVWVLPIASHLDEVFQCLAERKRGVAAAHARWEARRLALQSANTSLWRRGSSALYPIELGSVCKRSTFSLLKPVSTFVKFTRLRKNNPAPTSNTSDSVICEMTSVFANRLFVPAPCTLVPLSAHLSVAAASRETREPSRTAQQSPTSQRA